nr:hypothetical protein Iba_chr07aCG8530 [Ipomoea batatas]
MANNDNGSNSNDDSHTSHPETYEAVDNQSVDNPISHDNPQTHNDQAQPRRSARMSSSIPVPMETEAEDKSAVVLNGKDTRQDGSANQAGVLVVGDCQPVLEGPSIVSPLDPHVMMTTIVHRGSAIYSSVVIMLMSAIVESQVPDSPNLMVRTKCDMAILIFPLKGRTESDPGLVGLPKIISDLLQAEIQPFAILGQMSAPSSQL